MLYHVRLYVDSAAWLYHTGSRPVHTTNLVSREWIVVTWVHPWFSLEICETINMRQTIIVLTTFLTTFHGSNAIRLWKELIQKRQSYHHKRKDTCVFTRVKLLIDFYDLFLFTIYFVKHFNIHWIGRVFFQCKEILIFNPLETEYTLYFVAEFTYIIV